MRQGRSRSVAFTLAAGLFFPAAAAAQTREVVVGNISAMTGPTSGTHLMCQSGSRDYLNYLNETQGGITGKKGTVKTRYLAYDSQYVATKAKDGFARLLEQNMVIWTQCASAHSDALIVDYETAKVPLVTGSQGIASLFSDWAYGNYHSGIANMIRTWMLWRKGEWEKAGRPGGTLVLGAITTDEPFVPLALWDVDAFAKEQGIKVVKETFPKGATDAGPQLLRLRDAGATQIYVVASASGAVVALKSAKSLNLGIPMTQCAAATLGDVIALGGPELVEGYQGEFFFEPMSKDPAQGGSAGLKLARELWSRNHPKEAPNDMYINGVLSGMVIAEGIRLALDTVPPDKLTGEAIKRGLDQVHGFDGMGLTRPITYVKDDHIGPKQVRYWVVRKGYVEPISDWMPTTTYRIPKK
ncbi:MAG TPA: ABC transporter substrate-binding protein [Anaeromyxobacteraceae bacterium]|nr:ABC transporter substrate-binding protein [Anaeromyxobacteraceae bacterium]